MGSHECTRKCALTAKGLWGAVDKVRYLECEVCAEYDTCPLKGRSLHVFLYLESYFWLISLFIIVQESFWHLGLLVVGLTIIFSIFFFFIKNSIDRIAKQKIYTLAVLFYTGSWLLRGSAGEEMATNM